MESRLVALLVLSARAMYAQDASLSGVVKDPSGAAVPGANVNVRPARGARGRSTRTSLTGTYSFPNLSPGAYTLDVTAPGLALPSPLTVDITATPRVLDISLSVAIKQERVSVVEGEQKSVTTDAANNAGARVVKGEDLDALSDNPTDLASDLQALAGPGAGPNGASIFIDGFSGGELPPKESIREVRINQNPFSPEYDRLGMGRIEILTKPGSDKFRADIAYNFANQSWNSRNPYAAVKAPFHLNEIRGGVSGPINSRASFNVTFMKEWVDNGNIINAVTVAPSTLVTVPFTGNLMATLHRTGANPRFDFQINQNHTLTIRYSFNRDEVINAGAGGFNLATRGFRNQATSQTVQIIETAVLSTRTVNETRFQFFRPETRSDANSTGVALQVLGAFNGGGNPIGNTLITQQNYELQNATTIVHGAHVTRFGLRLRHAAEDNNSPQNFAGTYTFSGALAPQLDAAGNPLPGAFINISSLESYRRTLLFLQRGLAPAVIRSYGGGASQFSINTGNPLISGSQTDAGLFVGDDWRLRPNLTLNLGARYEAQSRINDWSNFAPRLGLAWAPSKMANPKSVIRAGFGTFYDRFGLGNSLNALRYNGVTQRQFVLSNPDTFPLIPALTTTGQNNTLAVSDAIRAPYLLQGALGFERKLPSDTTLSINYTQTRGLHLFRSQDINAPVNNLYPIGRPGLVGLMESTGIYRQRQLVITVNTKVNKFLSLTGTYMENRAKSNTDGINTYPARPYSMVGEYGPATTDIHHWASLGGTLTSPWNIKLNPLMTANSGPPFDITTGSDLYGTTLFNARPGFATSATKPGVVATPYGLLDPTPTAGQQLLSRNYGRGPGQIMMNLRIGRTFNFAKRYNLTTSMSIRNMLNHNNPGAIIGNITSPIFGRANQPAGSGGGIFSENANNRRLELQTRIVF